MESGFDNDSIDEQAVDWFVRLRAENVTRQEQVAFLSWLNQSPDHQQAFNEIGLLWGDSTLLQALTARAQAEAIAPKKKTSRIKRKWTLALAACLAVAILTVPELTIWWRADYMTALGERKTIQLSDGSKLVLNTDSALTVNIDARLRRIDLLKGEAYFEVAPDANRPFIVESNHATTRVLGTRFFVHQHPDKDEVKVLSGRVEVTEGRLWKTPVILQDREALNITASGYGNKHPLASALSTSWVNGFLVFQDASLDSVINQIRRYRRGAVVYKDQTLRDLKINGRLNLREPDEMLKVLQQTLDVKMTYLTDWLVIVG